MKINFNKEIIEKFLKENNMGKHRFCRICKISPKTLDSLMKGKASGTIGTIFRIAKILKIKMTELFIK